jgi:hypothetical protein
LDLSQYLPPVRDFYVSGIDYQEGRETLILVSDTGGLIEMVSFFLLLSLFFVFFLCSFFSLLFVVLVVSFIYLLKFF